MYTIALNLLGCEHSWDVFISMALSHPLKCPMKKRFGKFKARSFTWPLFILLQAFLKQSKSPFFFVGSLDNKHGCWDHHWEHTLGGESGASFQQPGHLSLFLNSRHCYLLVHIPQEAGACPRIQKDRNTVSIYCARQPHVIFSSNNYVCKHSTSFIIFHLRLGIVKLLIVFNWHFCKVLGGLSELDVFSSLEQMQHWYILIKIDFNIIYLLWCCEWKRVSEPLFIFYHLLRIDSACGHFDWNFSSKK